MAGANGNGNGVRGLTATVLMAALAVINALLLFGANKVWDEKELIQRDATELREKMGELTERVSSTIQRIERIYNDLKRLEEQKTRDDENLDIMLQREVDTKLAALREQVKCLEREVFGGGHGTEGGG